MTRLGIGVIIVLGNKNERSKKYMQKAAKVKIVRLSRIKISEAMRGTYPRSHKMYRKYDYYRKTGKFESQIVVDKHMVLKDGYTTYLLAKMFGFKTVVVVID